jgi:hypothetical protein
MVQVPCKCINLALIPPHPHHNLRSESTSVSDNQCNLSRAQTGEGIHSPQSRMAGQLQVSSTADLLVSEAYLRATTPHRTRFLAW